MCKQIAWLALGMAALTPAAARGDIIDLMIVWDAPAFANSNKASDIAEILGQTDDALSGAGVPHAFNLKYSHSIAPVSITAGNAQAALDFLKSDPEVKQLRNANGADVIIMVAENLSGTEGNTCGLAELPGRPSILFSETQHVAVVKRSCLHSSPLSVAAHELGHLLLRLA